MADTCDRAADFRRAFEGLKAGLADQSADHPGGAALPGVGQGPSWWGRRRGLTVPGSCCPYQFVWWGLGAGFPGRFGRLGSFPALGPMAGCIYRWRFGLGLLEVRRWSAAHRYGPWDCRGAERIDYPGMVRAFQAAAGVLVELLVPVAPDHASEFSYVRGTWGRLVRLPGYFAAELAVGRGQVPMAKRWRVAVRGTWRLLTGQRFRINHHA